MAMVKSSVTFQARNSLFPSENGMPKKSSFMVRVAPTCNHPTKIGDKKQFKSLKMIEFEAKMIREEVKRGEYRFRAIPGRDAIIGSSMTTTTGADEEMMPESPAPSTSHINDVVVASLRQVESAVQHLLIVAALTRCDDATNRYVFHSIFSVVSMYLSTHDVPGGLHFF